MVLFWYIIVADYMQIMNLYFLCKFGGYMSNYSQKYKLSEHLFYILIFLKVFAT